MEILLFASTFPPLKRLAIVITFEVTVYVTPETNVPPKEAATTDFSAEDETLTVE